MKIQSFAFAIAAVLQMFCAGVAAAASPIKFSIVQGATDSQTANFTILVRKNEAIQIKAAGQDPAKIERVTYPGSPWVLYRVRAENLKPYSTYALQVFNTQGKLLDERTFSSLDVNRADGRVGMGSCMVRQLHNPYMWNTIEAERPDVLLLIGDTVYLDRDNLLSAQNPTTGLQIWQAHAEARNTLNLYFYRHLMPVLTIWDDHDSGGDNVDANFPLNKEAHRIFEAYFANDAIEGFLRHGPGMAKQFQLFGQNFIMLDGRAYRDLDPASPLFGAEQINWLHEQIQTGPNFIISGSQFYGKFIRKDSLEFNWPDYTKTFTADLRKVLERKHATVTFGSGDLHFSEVQELEPDLLGFSAYEITSSSLHSFAFPGHYLLKPANPRRLVATGTHNVVMMDFAATRSEFKVRSVGWRGNTLFQLTLPSGIQACETSLVSEKSAH